MKRHVAARRWLGPGLALLMGFGIAPAPITLFPMQPSIEGGMAAKPALQTPRNLARERESSTAGGLYDPTSPFPLDSNEAGSAVPP